MLPEIAKWVSESVAGLALVRPRLLPAILVAAACGVMQANGWAQREASCTRGRPNAAIRVDVYSDYESPASRAFYLQTRSSFFADYADTGKACVIYHEYPQKDHPQALQAASYSQAAMRLGSRQWMLVAGAIFQAQSQWTKDGQLDPAVEKVLEPEEMEALRRQLQDGPAGAAVAEDVLSGLAQQVRSTPTIILRAGGKRDLIEGALRYSALKERLSKMQPD